MWENAKYDSSSSVFEQNSYELVQNEQREIERKRSRIAVLLEVCHGSFV
jgi:hypothetical protein